MPGGLQQSKHPRASGLTELPHSKWLLTAEYVGSASSSFSTVLIPLRSTSCCFIYLCGQQSAPWIDRYHPSKNSNSRFQPTRGRKMVQELEVSHLAARQVAKPQHPEHQHPVTHWDRSVGVPVFAGSSLGWHRTAQLLLSALPCHHCHHCHGCAHQGWFCSRNQTWRCLQRLESCHCWVCALFPGMSTSLASHHHCHTGMLPRG